MFRGGDRVCVCQTEGELRNDSTGSKKHMDTGNWLDRVTACLENLNNKIRQ